MSLRMLLVGAKGTVTHASRGADELLGSSQGRHCCDVVRARDASDAPVCSSGCAVAMARDGARERDTRQVNIRGRWWRLACVPMGTSTVITVLPDAPGVIPSAVLTHRKQEVLGLVADGLTSAEIARALKISPATVRTHVEHAREKLGAKTRAEAVARWLEQQRDAVAK